MKEQFNVVLIGAGSPQWGIVLTRDLLLTLSTPPYLDLYYPHLTLQDVDEKSLFPIFSLAKRINRILGNRVKISATTNKKKSLTHARYVITSLAVGGLKMMKYELEIPQEYGIYQPVGDTFSIGGAIRAVRNVPVMLNIARDIEKYADKNCWLINLSNPMSILCRAVTKVTKVQTVGCCHELYGGLDTLSDWLKEKSNAFKVKVLGINHCGWMYDFNINGKDGFTQLRRFLQKKGITQEVKRIYDSTCPELRRHNVKINLFLRYGILPYSGDRHTAEFFTDFVNDKTNRGADYGVLITTIQDRLVEVRGAARTNLYDILTGKSKLELTLSREAVARIISALELNHQFYDVGNVPYTGTNLPGLPYGTVIERMVTYRKNQIVPDEVSPLPEKPYCHLIQCTNIIEDIVTACITGNKNLLIQTLQQDYLLQNMRKDKIRDLVTRLLHLNHKYINPAFFRLP